MTESLPETKRPMSNDELVYHWLQWMIDTKSKSERFDPGALMASYKSWRTKCDGVVAPPDKIIANDELVGLWLKWLKKKQPDSSKGFATVTLMDSYAKWRTEAGVFTKCESAYFITTMKSFKEEFRSNGFVYFWKTLADKEEEKKEKKEKDRPVCTNGTSIQRGYCTFWACECSIECKVPLAHRLETVCGRLGEKACRNHRPFTCDSCGKHENEWALNIGETWSFCIDCCTPCANRRSCNKLTPIGFVYCGLECQLKNEKCQWSGLGGCDLVVLDENVKSPGMCMQHRQS